MNTSSPRTIIVVSAALLAFSVALAWIGYKGAICVVGHKPTTLEDYGGAFGAVDSVLGGLSSLLVVAALYFQMRDNTERSKEAQDTIKHLRSDLDVQRKLGVILATHGVISATEHRHQQLGLLVEQKTDAVREYRKQWEMTHGAHWQSSDPIDIHEKGLRNELASAASAREQCSVDIERLKVSLSCLMEKMTVTVAPQSE